MPRDPYEVLGVARDADDTTIKKAFRRLARELHPDVNSSETAEEDFKEAAEAYEILSDSERRATFDRYGFEGLRSGGYAPPDFSGFGSLGDIFDAFFGGGGFGGGAGGPFGGGRGMAVQGGDVAVSVEIDLGAAATGTSAEVSYDAITRCERCRGNGAEPGTPIETCERCGGTGRLQAVTRTPFGQVVRTVECDVCGGDGRVAKEPCHECRGRGRRVQRVTVKVDVPAGIADGQRIRIAGRGHEGEFGGPAGDLYVQVRVAEDPRFVRDGDDLVTVLDVPAPQAALGTTLQVETLDGTEEVEVAPGTQPGEVIVIHGHGMPALRGRRRGNLRAVVNVIVPRHLSREQRRLMHELADSITDENLRSDESVFQRLRRALRA
jgi:molecular chaperone DnaJ